MNERIWGIIGGVALLLALLSPLVLGNSKKVERLFEDAEGLYERSNYEGAIEKYKEALKESSKPGAKTEHIDKNFTTLVNLKIAQCYYYLGEKTHDINYFKAALVHIEKVSSKTHVAGHQEELTHLWADILYKTGKFDSAESKFNQLIKNFPKSQWTPKALYIIGEINYQQENRQKALSTLKRLVDEFPHSEFTVEARRRIKELSSDDPVPPDQEPLPPQEVVMYNKATNLKQQGKVHDAHQLFTNLITRFPDSKHVPDAYIGKAEIHLEAKNYIKARENYEEAIYSTNDEERRVKIYEAYHRTYLVPVYESIQSEPSDELFIKGRLLRKEHRFQEAAEIYEKLANSNLTTEDTIYALYWLGRCYHDAVHQDPTLTDAALLRKSVDAFKKLIENYEDSSYTIKAYYYLALTYSNWAEALANQSKYQSVIDIVEEAETKYADTDDTTYRAHLSLMLELQETAIQKLYPDPKPPEPPEPSPISLVNQGHTHLKQNELEEATKKAKQALDINRNYELADKLLSEIKERHYGRGWKSFDEELYDQAIVEFKSAINIDSNFKEAHFHLGVIYIEQNRHSEAIEAFEKAISIDDRFKEAYFNLGLAHFESGEREAAKKAADKALIIDPNYEPARVLIEFITK